jgi:hypothetical protein
MFIPQNKKPEFSRYWRENSGATFLKNITKPITLACPASSSFKDDAGSRSNSKKFAMRDLLACLLDHNLPYM